MERINATTGSYNFIDLFAGAGGLSEGFIQAGFSPVAHVEMNPYAAQTLETRTGYYYLKAQGKLDIYKDYISGKITRDEFLQHIPEEQLQSVFCETMSNETLPRLFENIDNREVVDLLYFPTGGGKTEAYLGLMAFVIANRRLRAEENDEYNLDGGVTAILRYTLRLLTTQQRDRITKMILAAELIRQKEYAEHEIDDFISNWKLLATQSKELRYYVYTTKTYNRLMNTYGEVCTDLEKVHDGSLY